MKCPMCSSREYSGGLTGPHRRCLRCGYNGVFTVDYDWATRSEPTIALEHRHTMAQPMDEGGGTTILSGTCCRQ